MPRFNGHTTLARVEANESIIVTDGSLTILGDVGQGARITLEKNQSNRSNQISFSDPSAGCKLTVQGNVHAGVSINSFADLKFQGYLFNAVTAKTYNGDIIAQDLDRNVTLSSYNGNISTGDVEANSSVKSHNGKVSVGNVAANATIKSYNGNVLAISHDPSATIKTHNGKRYINGVRTDNRRENRNNITITDMNVSSNSNFPFNFSNFFSSGTTTIPDRVFINRVAQTASRQTELIDRNTIGSIPENLQSYINSFKGKESFQDAFKRLNIEVGEGFSCNILYDVPNIPVLLNGYLYDWESLKNLPIDASNKYTDPMTRGKFTLTDIMPGRVIRTILEEKIKEAEKTNTPSFKR
jgi:hypothetical protein